MTVRAPQADGGPIAVALSGGVDSAVVAARLVAAGHAVIGVTARLAAEQTLHGDGGIHRAAEVCARLRIEHHVRDLTVDFAREVIEPFLDDYAAGLTPNPCLRCNPRLKFGALLDVARQLGCARLATGHYALRGERAGRQGLCRATDASKDQSYMLMGIGPDQLAAAVFPLGQSHKAEVIEQAHRLGLPHLERQSQDVCFISGSVEDHLARFLQLEPGPIIDLHGRRLGTHRGLPLYTVGQRRGLAVGGTETRLHVIHKLPEQNTLVVGPREALCRRQFSVTSANWVSIEAPPPGGRLRCQVMVRYRGRLIPAEVTALEAGACLVEVQPHSQAIAPGQGAAFYDGDGWLLGGGTISPEWP
jgi:tRNA-specific 2-thiouridylase